MSHIETIAREKHDAFVLAQIIVQRYSGDLTEAEALSAPLGLEEWGHDRPYKAGQKIRHGERAADVPQLYEVARDIEKSLATQPPGSEGTLALYRPVNPEHGGTLDDPIPYVYGMDCTTGRYYAYQDAVYLCKGDMLPCIWPPDTAGVWQWEAVGAAG